MYNSQYYTCEQIDQRLLQGYLDDYNTENGTSLTKAQFLNMLHTIIGKSTTVDNLVAQLGYYECDTAAGTAAKAITVTNYTLLVGGSIKVKFVNQNTADSVTLNINSTGAKPLYYDGERASASNSWEAGEIVDIYYDGTSYYANNVAGGGKFLTGEKVKEVGIDDELTPDSENLVKSGAVYKGISDVKQGYVDVNENQDFTERQKQTARNNIGASSVTDLQIIMSQLVDLRTKDNFITKNLGYKGTVMAHGVAQALQPVTSGDASIAWVVFTYGDENSPSTAMIHQKHGETTTVQTLFYGNRVVNRTITFTDSTKTSIESTTAWSTVTNLFGVQATQNSIVLRLMNSHLDGSQGLYSLTLPAVSTTQAGVIAPSQFASLVNGGDYDSNSKSIILRHDSTVLVRIDATAFIKDGMVSNVTIRNGQLVIIFNTDAGKEDIRIPLTEIFNPDNYYTKNDIDNLFVQSSTVRTIVTLTQAEFDALQNKDANTEYNIIES